MKMKSKAARACAVMQAVAMVKDYDHAVTIYDALAKSFGSINTVLEFYDTERWIIFDDMDDAEYWEMIEDNALNFDAAVKHFGENK
jgi:hypothetical protein